MINTLRSLPLTIKRKLVNRIVWKTIFKLRGGIFIGSFLVLAHLSHEMGKLVNIGNLYSYLSYLRSVTISIYLLQVCVANQQVIAKRQFHGL